MKSLKTNRKSILAILLTLVAILISVYIEKFIYSNGFSIHRAFIYLLFIFLVFVTSFFDYRKVWNIIFEKRYLIGILLFAFMVAMGYNTSSFAAYDKIIQPSSSSENYYPFWNNYRDIRSDEFLGGTPVLLSQKYIGTFSTINNAIMARKTSVLLYPKLTTFNISVLASPALLGFFFLDANHAFSFNTLLMYFISFFAVLELLLIMTKQKKLLSVVGSSLLTFAPSVLWWGSSSYIAYMALCLLAFYKFITSDNWKKRILYSALLGLFGSWFVSIIYPAWQIPYGYLALLIGIWMLIENKDNLKLKYLLYLLISIAIVIIIVLPAILGSQETIKLLANTVYPGARNSVGGGSTWVLFFQYMSSLLYGVKSTVNPSETAQYFSLYPIPVLLGIWQCAKNIKEKHNDFLLLFLTVYVVLLSLWNYIPIGIFSKITLLYMSTPYRSQVIASLTCIFIMVKLISDYSTTLFSLKKIMFATIISFFTILVCIIAIEKRTPGYLTPIRTGFLSMIFFVLIILLIINNKRTNKYFLLAMLFISIFTLLTVNPITSGIKVMTDKPLAKEVRKIDKKDKNSIWFTENSLHTSNYILANGARVINSVNYYPNLTLWHKIDKSRKYSNVYNRFAHVVMEVTNDKTKFKLIQSDCIKVLINSKDVCKINANYLVTDRDTLDEYNNDTIKFIKIYKKENINIYKIMCSNG